MGYLAGGSGSRILEGKVAYFLNVLATWMITAFPNHQAGSDGSGFYMGAALAETEAVMPWWREGKT